MRIIIQGLCSRYDTGPSLRRLSYISENPSRSGNCNAQRTKFHVRPRDVPGSPVPRWMSGSLSSDAYLLARPLNDSFASREKIEASWAIQPGPDRPADGWNPNHDFSLSNFSLSSKSQSRISALDLHDRANEPNFLAHKETLLGCSLLIRPVFRLGNS